MTVYGKRQSTFDDYAGFVEKFRPKKTTDDCYTPPKVYDAVLGYVRETYGIGSREVVRPFFPGGDYEGYDYPDGCVVVDNPPFSMISKIVSFYDKNGIDFFLFAPALITFSIKSKCCHVVTDGEQVRYDNGAKIQTGFLTSLDDALAVTSPALAAAIHEAQESDRAGDKKRCLPSYDYPDELCTVSMLSRICKGGEVFRIEHGEIVRALDDQRIIHKGIFGYGVLVSGRKAAEKRAAEKRAAEKRENYRFVLSEREREIVRALED